MVVTISNTIQNMHVSYSDEDFRQNVDEPGPTGGVQSFLMKMAYGEDSPLEPGDVPCDKWRGGHTRGRGGRGRGQQYGAGSSHDWGGNSMGRGGRARGRGRGYSGGDGWVEREGSNPRFDERRGGQFDSSFRRGRGGYQSSDRELEQPADDMEFGGMDVDFRSERGRPDRRGGGQGRGTFGNDRRRQIEGPRFGRGGGPSRGRGLPRGIETPVDEDERRPDRLYPQGDEEFASEFVDERESGDFSNRGGTHPRGRGRGMNPTSTQHEMDMEQPHDPDMFASRRSRGSRRGGRGRGLPHGPGSDMVRMVGNDSINDSVLHIIVAFVKYTWICIILLIISMYTRFTALLNG